MTLQGKGRRGLPAVISSLAACYEASMNVTTVRESPMYEARTIKPSSAESRGKERSTKERRSAAAHSESHNRARTIWVVANWGGDDRWSKHRDRHSDAHDDTSVGSRRVKAACRAERQGGNQSSGVTHCQLLKNWGGLPQLNGIAAHSLTHRQPGAKRH